MPRFHDRARPQVHLHAHYQRMLEQGIQPHLATLAHARRPGDVIGPVLEFTIQARPHSDEGSWRPQQQGSP